jgi:hypothetical protein
VLDNANRVADLDPLRAAISAADRRVLATSGTAADETESGVASAR